MTANLPSVISRNQGTKSTRGKNRKWLFLCCHRFFGCLLCSSFLVMVHFVVEWAQRIPSIRQQTPFNSAVFGVVCLMLKKQIRAPQGKQDEASDMECCQGRGILFFGFAMRRCLYKCPCVGVSPHPRREQTNQKVHGKEQADHKSKPRSTRQGAKVERCRVFGGS